jgi:predicted transcriptional regulator
MAFTLRLDDDAREELRRLAEVEGVSQQEAVRRAIRDRSERLALHTDVAEAAARGATRYAELLDRLSK